MLFSHAFPVLGPECPLVHVSTPFPQHYLPHYPPLTHTTLQCVLDFHWAFLVSFVLAGYFREYLAAPVLDPFRRRRSFRVLQAHG